MEQVWTERVLLDRLRARHLRARAGNGPEWAYMEHVRDDAGFFAGTTIDALALHLWPSKRHVLHAYEVKVSRSDWRRELAQPHKSAPWLAVADFFTVVAAPGIVRVDELPEGWGLLEPSGPVSLRSKVSAVQLTPTLPWPQRQAALERGLVAAMLRSAARTAERGAAAVHAAQAVTS
jgi:hypothetical protein